MPGIYLNAPNSNAAAKPSDTSNLSRLADLNDGGRAFLRVVEMKLDLDPNADINPADKDGHTALHAIAANGDVDVLKAYVGLMLKQNPQVNLSPEYMPVDYRKQGCVPLHLVARSGKVDALYYFLKELLKQNPEMNLLPQTRDGRTPFDAMTDKANDAALLLFSVIHIKALDQEYDNGRTKTLRQQINDFESILKALKNPEFELEDLSVYALENLHKALESSSLPLAELTQRVNKAKENAQSCLTEQKILCENQLSRIMEGSNIGEPLSRWGMQFFPAELSLMIAERVDDCPKGTKFQEMIANEKLRIQSAVQRFSEANPSIRIRQENAQKEKKQSTSSSSTSYVSQVTYSASSNGEGGKYNGR